MKAIITKKLTPLIIFKNCLRLCTILIIAFTLLHSAQAQPQSKQVINQYQTWISLNSYARLSNKWGIMNDIHWRTNHFFESTNFVLVRLGGIYWLSDKTSVAAGYTRMWLAPASEGLHQYSDGNWIYQQIQYITKTKAKNIGVFLRLRNEQRWQQRIVNDKVDGNIFSNRIRMLANFSIPFSHNVYVPSLALADELMVQFGKDITYNTFDQNRVFAGIKQTISKAVSFDLGYMMVFQQRANGYQYNKNNTLRLFFYYRPDFRKKS